MSTERDADDQDEADDVIDQDELDQLGEDDFDAEDTRNRVIRLARGEGALVAYQALLDICRDKKAPAAARSNASRTLAAMAGMLTGPAPSDDENVQEPTREQLIRMARRSDRYLQRQERLEAEARRAVEVQQSTPVAPKSPTGRPRGRPPGTGRKQQAAKLAAAAGKPSMFE